MDKEGPPPFGWAVNGKPVLTRDGRQIAGSRRQRVMLDVCDPCNGAMNTLIELPAKDPITKLALHRWRGRHSQAEWRAVGIWLAKVILLVGHPDSKLENPRLHKLANMDFDGPPPDIRWLSDGSGPPDHLSLFVHRADLKDRKTAHQLVVPAQVNFGDGKTRYCHLLSLATPGLSATLISHPGLKIDHPMVKRRQAWELLHSPPKFANLSRLRRRSHKHVIYMRGGGAPAGHVVSDDEFNRLLGMFGYETDDSTSTSTPQRLRRRALRILRNRGN